MYLIIFYVQFCIYKMCYQIKYSFLSFLSTEATQKMNEQKDIKKKQLKIVEIRQISLFQKLLFECLKMLNTLVCKN